MDLKRGFLKTAAVILAAAVLFSVPVRAEPVISAKSAILMDGRTGRVLYEKEPDRPSLIASTTKIMTGLLIAESCDLDAEVSISKEAAETEGSSLYLQEGEILTVEALLYGLMLHSGNDAAVALAMYHAGSLEAFGDAMNRKGRELGLENTHFSNPHGLDGEDHYSTARDLARLTAHALENQVFRQVVSTKTITFGDRTITNHNKLLWQYDGAIGVKTGYTMAAGRVLVSAAERDGQQLIAVTIDDPKDWQDHKALFDLGFDRFQRIKLASAGQTLASVPVLCGAERMARAVLREEIVIPLAEEEEAVLVPSVPPVVYAPVLAGEQAGTVAVMINGSLFREYPLYWQYSILEEA